MLRSLTTLAFVALAGLACPAWADEDPFATNRTPLQLSDPQGHPLADGHLIQTRTGDRLEVKLEFHYADGRQTVESATFTVSPQVVQHAWSFEERSGATLKRRFFVDFDKGSAGGMKSKDHGQPDTWIKNFKPTPGKTFAGVGFVYAMLQRLPALGQGSVELEAVGFIPRPEVVSVILHGNAPERIQVGNRIVNAERVTIHPNLGFLTKLIANPKDFNLWFEASAPRRYMRSLAPMSEPNDPMVRVDVLAP